MAHTPKMVHAVLLTTTLLCMTASAQKNKRKKLDRPKPDRVTKYKTVGDINLRLHIFEPPVKSESPRPAIVFFFGGGWVGGSPSQFFPHARHLADQGMVAMCAEYRIRSKHKTTPFECVKDGKSAIRWVRKNAKRLNVDAKRIAAGGGSAGGHVAAATGTLPKLDEETDDMSISSVPNALVLFNPVYDNGPDGYGHSRVKKAYKDISPMHNIRKGVPPAIVFLGTKDKLIPVSTAKKFQEKMSAVGSKSVLKLYEGAAHGFFNFGGKYYDTTVEEMDHFLSDLGYLKKATQEK